MFLYFFHKTFGGLVTFKHFAWTNVCGLAENPRKLISLKYIENEVTKPATVMKHPYLSDMRNSKLIFKLVFISKPSKHKNKAKRREHMAQVDFDLTFRSPLAVTFSPTTSFLRHQRLKYFNSLGEQNFAADGVQEK